MNKDIYKIAIVRLSALGDIVNSAIVLQFIHAKYPNAQIEWIAEEVFSPLLNNHPLLNAVHTLNLKKFKKEKSLKSLNENLKKIKSFGQFDLIIDMQGLIKSAIVSRLLGKETHGFNKNSTRESLAACFYKTSTNISYESGVVKRNTFLIADALGFEISQEMILNKKSIFEINKKFDLDKTTKNVAFVIGASWESKIYPKEMVVDICNDLKLNAFIIWGNAQEKENAEWIVENSNYASLAPELALDELVSFISNMDLVIGNDTGPTHMAWAQNIPSITLLGPTTTRMIQETPLNIGIKSPSNVDLLKINKNDFSIREIPYETIVQKAKELIDGI
ncbi:lipopolysaccharide heptosyltransferase I [Sulfurimonas aquatica]|uniref:Lipopolysaccharide heptosyltransferase 1 n=1 Tax=Sulfurimonas aquatica TaxID=2672570 RepID=A0A975B1M6_9BACT|nr:lipopolysaccharide heptosyltransferase I [Sulfurimonas aquatica]QSZ42586.1 lipopolysaccharide heptosyltransferase I [Sulfurimonas aquatica]